MPPMPIAQPNRLPPTRTIRLLVLDIDGTISGESNQISPAVLQTVKAVQAQGIQVRSPPGGCIVRPCGFIKPSNPPFP